MPKTIDPNAVRDELLKRLSQPLPHQATADLAACHAIDRLEVSLRTLRLALDAAQQAPGLLGMPAEDGKPTEAGELRTRWLANIKLLSGAVEAIETDGRGVITAVKAMLALD